VSPARAVAVMIYGINPSIFGYLGAFSSSRIVRQQESKTMSERTAAALAKIDVLIPALSDLPAGPARDEIVDVAQALRRAIATFHMEAIRFRMHSMERMMKAAGADEPTLGAFDALRQALEAAGFHTRSHTAP
jgi:hypothetical protein